MKFLLKSGKKKKKEVLKVKTYIMTTLVTSAINAVIDSS
jgi:hypothetical protein